MSLQLPQNASPKKINELTVATTVQPTDITVIIQNGVTKQAQAALFAAAVTQGAQNANVTLSAIAALTTPTGFMAFLGAGQVTAYTLTGTAGEITVLNGGGSATPVFSLPTALIFTGKTVSGGTFNNPTITNATIVSATITNSTISFSSLNVSGNAIIGGNLTVSGNTDISGNEVIHGNLTVSGTVTLPNFLSSSAPANLAPTASAGTALNASRSDHVHQYQVEEFLFAASDETTALTTGTAKITFLMKLPRILLSAEANLTVANSASVVSGPLTVDINASGVSIFGTNKLIVSNGSTTSRNAATQPSYSATAFPSNTTFTLDIDNVGSAASATGLKVTFIWRQNS